MAVKTTPLEDILVDRGLNSFSSLRGLLWRSMLESCGVAFRVDANARIRTPSRVRIGDNVWIKEGVLINGRSEHDVGIWLDDGVIVRAYTYIDAYDGQGFVRVGPRAGIGQGVYIGGNGGVDIGADVMISGHCYIVAANHNIDAGSHLPYHSQGETREGIRICDNAWIAAGSVILDGVTIGASAVVAAGSVVTKDVAPYTLVAGCPAKLVRTLGAARGDG